ncbi:MAG: PAS domain S-box protein, partial [Dehalococcoidia bacterium]
SNGGVDIGGALDSLPFYVMLVDAKHRILFANKVMSQSLKMDSKDIIGAYCPKLVHGVDDFHGCPLHEVIETNQAVEREVFDPRYQRWLKPIIYPTGQFTADEQAVFLHLTYDITEAKQNEDTYKNIIENSTNFFYSHTIEHILTFLSPQIINILGYTPEEAKVKWTELLSDNPMNEKGIQITEEGIRSGKSQPPYKLEMLHKNGERVLLEIRETPLVIDGKTVSIIGAATDITNRRRDKEALLESKEYFQALFNGVSDAVFVHQPVEDKPGKYIEVNDAACQMLGYSRAEFNHLTSIDIAKGQYNDAVPSLSTLKRLKETGSFLGERTYITKDGHEIPVEINSHLVVLRNIPTVITLARDISARKQAEKAINQAAEEWHTTFDSISDPISIQDSDFTIIRVNKAYAQYYGEKAETIVGKKCFEMSKCGNESRSTSLDCPHAITIKSGKAASHVRFDAIRGKYIEGFTFPILDKHQKTVATVHMTKDITERKKAEKEQQQLRDKAEMSSRLAAVGEMAAGIAHEINNPLTGVIGFSELLMDMRDLPEVVLENLKIINDGSIRVKDIVRRMLTFARQPKPQKSTANITELIDNILELRGYVLKTANIHVIRDYEQDLPWVTVDPGQLQQVFLNLIVNAEHAMKKAHDKGILIIKTERLDDHIRVSVTDDGLGMSDKVMAKIFQPFYTTKEVDEGTGLGISLSHGIIQEHGGTIRVESVVGLGTTFIIELPITSIEEDSEIAITVADTSQAMKRAKILVVDDEPAVRALVRAILTVNGHTMEECD